MLKKCFFEQIYTWYFAMVQKPGKPGKHALEFHYILYTNHSSSSLSRINNKFVPESSLNIPLKTNSLEHSFVQLQ